MDRRRNAVYLIIILSLLAGMVTGRGFFFNVAYAFAGLLVVSIVWAWGSVNWLHFRRQTRTRRAQMGGYLEEMFAVRNTSLMPKLWLEVYDHSDLIGHRAGRVISNLGPHGETSWRVRTLCVRRGAYQLGPMRVVTGDPFGLFQAERRISATSPLLVYPATVDLAVFALPIGSLPGGESLRRRTHYVTTNAAGVRDYAPGDSFGRIHWRSTARKGRLIVKEFELDPLSDIWIMMDADRAVHVGEYNPSGEDVARMMQQAAPDFAIPPTTEEYAVTVTASLARYFLQRERSVGLALDGNHLEIIQTDRGARQMTKILEMLAVVQAHGATPFDQLIEVQGNQLSRGTTAVLVTPSTRDTWVTAAHGLLRRGLRVVAVVVDPYSFGGRPGAAAVALRLGTLGIPTYVVHQGDNLQAALGRLLS